MRIFDLHNQLRNDTQERIFNPNTASLRTNLLI